MNSFAVLTIGLGIILLNLTTCYGALQVGFYKGKCGTKDVESIIRGVVEKRFETDRSIVAALLRMQFHDCFVSGCDASLLLNGASSEKTAPPNLSVRGYDIIDQAKAAVEEACRGVVSCADIISIATRDAVSMSGGMNYKVQTGRRDGFVSQAKNVNLPPPSISVSDSIAAFAQKGLNKTDMVLLLGGHTVGITHCSLIQNRLYNFRNSGKPDGTMEPSLAKNLKKLCPRQLKIDSQVNLDQTFNSSLVVDNGFYKQVKMRRGILEIDQGLGLDPLTSSIVWSLAADKSNFQARFGAAMIKLGAVEVLTGNKGEIRKTCGAVNPPKPKPISNLISSLIKP
ncbi:Plant peroxidase [Macleaya cordata]|uniref:Peroxidase n=1 Tax=Macleaya cordata TaxID=56857 RepID=A0A200QQG6_MACCD|nr:Plant peroxidase [Macleaya cordata]